MEIVGTVQRPTRKLAKVGDHVKPVIVLQTIIPYTRETWAFVGENADIPLNVTLEPAQHEMFNPETGEIEES